MKWLLLLITINVTGLSALQNAKKEFNLLMGQDTPNWQYVQTQEDWQRLDSFREIYSRQILHLYQNKHAKQEIPSTLHIIWLGPHEFPKKSILHLGKWIKYHPDWTIKFWTDTDRPAPLEGIVRCKVQDFPFAKLGKAFAKSSHFVEKAKMLAYEILYKEGGVYVSQDVVPIKNFSPLNRAYHFYCGLEQLSTSMLSTSVFPSTHVIGATSGHPILEEALTFLGAQYDRLQEIYPGTKPIEVMNRIAHRTVWALAEGVDRGIEKQGRRDIIFPSQFFNDPKRRPSSFAIYLRNDHWSKQFTPFEAKVTTELTDIVKGADESIWTMLTVGALSAISCGSLLFLLFRGKRRGYA